MATDQQDVRDLKFSMESPAKSPPRLLTENAAVVQRPAKQKVLPVIRKPRDLYAQALRWALVATAVVAAAIITLAYHTGVAAFEVAAVAGALGGFFSFLLRMAYTAHDRRADAAGPSVLDRAVYAIVPPLVGAIAAGFCYIMFAAGVFEGGSFFPKFGCSNSAGCSSFTDFVNHFGPTEAVHYARLCVWSFAAGFAERLLPDRLRTDMAREPAT
jgi:hypothetical protein